MTCRANSRVPSTNGTHELKKVLKCGRGFHRTAKTQSNLVLRKDIKETIPLCFEMIDALCNSFRINPRFLVRIFG